MLQPALCRTRRADCPRPARPGAAPRRAAALRPRCAAPSQEPKAGVSAVPPSLQSIQDGGGEGYMTPLISLDWGEQALAETPASAADAALMEPAFDVCGVGQCLIDVNVNVTREMLDALDVPHGGRRVITVGERDALLRQLEQVPDSMAGAEARTLSMFNLNNVTPGGSLLNTLVGLSRLGSAASLGSRPLRIAMAGCVGGEDRLGGYVRQQLRAAGVAVVRPGAADGPGAAIAAAAAAAAAGAKPGAHGGTTGTVMVFCTPDAQRSFLSCIPGGDAVVLSPELLRAAARSRLLVIEGYLLDLPGAGEALPALVAAAKAAGTVVALTMGDAGVVSRSAETIAACIAAGSDLLFANKREALALTASPPVRALLEAASAAPAPASDDDGPAPLPAARNAAEAAAQLSRLAPMVVVTDGSRGSYVAALGATQVFPPRWSKCAPVDTCGAGDNYAAGLLYGLLSGMDIGHVGQVAAHTASRVIARHGPQLDPTDARRVVLSAARSLADAAAGTAGAPAVGGAAGSGVAAGRSLMTVLEARALLAAEAASSDDDDAAPPAAPAAAA
ncbi:hypothetical protein Rsub_05734 [Raphidocelis subcapitata]|uniref:Carbohydrate kinase PfkB domain-containing protein n=1 Tax=Raphidocelis subcapitata TaxID=307507 RepID=A0A2V0NZ31_9CHLO|nr:hypothetical protein Rsub_05734 [Raphidocelis subcapitata]|eukprot:GBF92898.1 hypothetical protein Rsub_05734 [Raphidocelis subcapitata]